MSEKLSYRVLPLDPDSPDLAAAIALYRAVWGDELPLRRQAGYPGFRGMKAVAPGGDLVGFAFGTTALPDQWWPSRVAPVIGAERAERELYGSFVIYELVVSSDWRRHGIATRLMHALLAGLPQPRVTLSTECDNMPARALYARLGFQPLVERMRFRPDAEEYTVLGRALPLDER